MKNAENFIKSIQRKIKTLKDDGFYRKEELAENLLNRNVNRDYDEITDYDIAFWELYQDNENVHAQIEKYLELLKEQEHFRQDISSLGVLTMIREIRPPEENTSKWQLLYETLLLPTDESGPILHLYFDGWEIVDHKIYYFDEMGYNDNDEGIDNQYIQEDDIYNMITDSAKTRFDYLSFEKNLSIPDFDLNIADKILWTMLMYLAIGEKTNIIALKIKTDIMLSGFIIDEKVIENSIINNQNNWKNEIGVLKMTTDMLNTGFATKQQVYEIANIMLAE